MPKCTLRLEVSKLTTDNAMVIKKLLDEHLASTTWSPELAYRALTGANPYTLHYGTGGAIDIGRPDVAIPKLEAAIAELLAAHEVALAWKNEVPGVAERFAFAVTIKGAPAANHDQLYEALKQWAGTVDVDGDIIVDILGAGPKTRVEAYTPGKVAIAGGWQRLGEECKALQAQLHELIGDGELRVERI